MSMTRTFRSGGQVAVFPIAREAVRLSRVYGYFNSNNNASTPVWLQIFTTTLSNAGAVNPPTAAQVPLESFLLPADYEFAELFNSGLDLVPGPTYAALSTTEATYTAVASGQVADMYITCEEWEIEPPTLTTVTTASGIYQSTWTDTIAAPSAAKALYDVLVSDLNANAGAQLYVQLFFNGGASIPANGSIPNRCFELPIYATAGDNINLTGALLLNFGDPEKGGMVPLGNTGQPLTDVAQTNGFTGLGNTCSAMGIAISTTATTLTAGAAGSAKIVSRYITATV
jgi:hypothetical protein